MKPFMRWGVIFGIGILALAPLIHAVGGGLIPGLTTHVIASMNLLAWSFVLTFMLAHDDRKKRISRRVQSLGLDPAHKSLDRLLDHFVTEFERKSGALSLNLLERRISSREELSRTLEKTVGLAYRLLDAESAELALYDKSTSLYHASFVMGKPFRSTAQAMLSGAIEDRQEQVSTPDVMVHPIVFAGSVLGSLRVGLKRGRLPTPADQELMRLLALQGSLALINAQYTEELIKMKRSSEETVKAKTGFLANLSHEIRGPLGIMLNAVELVLDGLCGPVSSDQLETLRMVKVNGDHLLELINDVLDFAKVEAGKIKPDSVDISANDLLQDVCAVVRSQADSKKHRLIFRSSAEALAFSCDRRHARQMLINLLTNAIKYTPDGGTIEVWAERAPRNRIKLNVKDTGVGIAQPDHAKVFAAFERVEHAYSMKQMGTGLGMPLTKRLAEVNGGAIDFTSALGKGAHFWLLFPSVELKAPIEITTQAPALQISGGGDVILLVQADQQERAMVARYLTHVGFSVLQASSADEVEALLTGHAVSLALIDNDVADQPEHGIIRSVQTGHRGKPIPIVITSSRAFVFDIERYLKNGIDRCLVKPLELAALARTCRELIDATRRPAALLGGNSKSLPSGATSRTPKVDDLLH